MDHFQLHIKVGAKIKTLRSTRKLTQNELAMMCNFEKASMSRIEAGKSNITLLTLQKISAALNINTIELFRENDDAN